MVELKGLRKVLNHELLFEQEHLTIQSGDKIALVGPNACGKTTFLKIITGKDPAEGPCWIFPTAKVGYLTQDVFDLLSEKALEQLFYRDTFEERGKVQNLMKHIGFNGFTIEVSHPQGM